MPRIKLQNVIVAPVARVIRTEAIGVPGNRRAHLSVTGMVCGL